MPSIHDPDGYWDPVFEACDETGTVVCMHIGSGSKMAETSPFAPRAANTALTFSMAQLSLVEWLVSGLLVRFPKLKIAYSESQIGWIPFILERLDNVFAHPAYAELPSVITQPPSTYLPGRVYGCFFDDETGSAQPRLDRGRASSCSRSTTRTRTPRGPTRIWSSSGWPSR